MPSTFLSAQPIRCAFPVPEKGEQPWVGRAPRILLVEDNDLDVELAHFALDEHGLSDGLTVVRDGQEALDELSRKAARASRGEPGYALVLLDLNMPRVDGYEVLQRLQQDERWRTLPVVVLTASNTLRDRERCAGLGAAAYLVKPFDYDQFAAVARRLLEPS